MRAFTRTLIYPVFTETVPSQGAAFGLFLAPLISYDAHDLLDVSSRIIHLKGHVFLCHLCNLSLKKP